MSNWREILAPSDFIVYGLLLSFGAKWIMGKWDTCCLPNFLIRDPSVPQFGEITDRQTIRNVSCRVSGLNLWDYSRVHKSSDSFFSKILEKPFIVQKKMIPHIKGLDFSQRWSKKKFKMADLENWEVETFQCPSHQSILLTQGPIHEIFMKKYWELAELENEVFLRWPFWIF